MTDAIASPSSAAVTTASSAPPTSPARGARSSCSRPPPRSAARRSRASSRRASGSRAAPTSCISWMVASFGSSSWHSHGLKWARTGLKTVALAQAGEHLVLDGGKLVSGTLSEGDRQGLADYHARMLRFARVLAKQHNRQPPRLGGGGRSDLVGAAKLGLDIRRLGRDDARVPAHRRHQHLRRARGDLSRSPLLKGALALDAVLGTNLGPRSNNSVLALLHRLSGAGRRAMHGPSHCREGGMGAVTEALAAAARAAGATIRTGSPVARITLEGDAVSGVRARERREDRRGHGRLQRRSCHDAASSWSAPDISRRASSHRVRHFRSNGMAAKLHLALDGLARVLAAARRTRGRASRHLAGPDLPRARLRSREVRPVLARAGARDHDSVGARPDARARRASTCCRRSSSTRPTTRARAATARARIPRARARRARAPRAGPAPRRSWPRSCCCPPTSSASSASRVATGTTASSRSTSS